MKKWLVMGMLLGLIAFAFWKFDLKELIVEALSWIQGQGMLGWLAFVALYIVSTVLLVPGLILTLGAGFVWGPLMGSLIVSVASTLGASAAFLTGRYLARGWVEKKLGSGSKVNQLDKALAGNAFQIVALTRLSPVFPFTLLNYMYGLSAVPFRSYFLASWLGMIPGTILYVYIGSLVGSLSELGQKPAGAEDARQWFYWIGLAVTALVTVKITQIARKTLAKEGFNNAA